jgi:hypothetical protein
MLHVIFCLICAIYSSYPTACSSPSSKNPLSVVVPYRDAKI